MKSHRSAHLSLAWTIRRWQQLSLQTRVSQPSRQPPLDWSSGAYRWTTTVTRSRVTSTGRPRPLVPDTWQRTVFDAVHDLSHPSIRATKQLVAAKFVWPGVRKQVGIRAKTCLRCQAAKVHRHTTAPVDQFVPSTRRFDHIHIDIVGSLPPSQNYRYLLTVVDRFTRWPEAIPLVDAQTTTCAKALALHWIARFGVPAELNSDRGSQFTSELWTTLSQLNGTRLHRTTAYHPQSNGIVERFHLKSALMARLTGPDWIDELP